MVYLVQFLPINLALIIKKKIDQLFLKVGKIVWLKNENKIDKATAISGSGPGYIFTIINSFEQAAKKLGFSKNQSRDLVLTTILGSIYLMQASKKEPKELEKIILCDAQIKIYPELEKSFLNMLHNSGYPDIKFEKKIDFENLYMQRFN